MTHREELFTELRREALLAWRAEIARAEFPERQRARAFDASPSFCAFPCPGSWQRFRSLGHDGPKRRPGLRAGGTA